MPVLRTRGIYLALATFALGQVVQASLLNMNVVGGAAGYPVTAFIRLPVVIGFAVVVMLLVWLLFTTRFGIAARAVHDDERVADLMGIEVRGFQVAAFALGSLISGIGGGIYAHHFSFIEAQYFNITLSITIVLYVLLGGTQTVFGPLIGAAVFTLAARTPARQRQLALRGVRRRHHRADGAAAAGADHRRHAAPPVRLARSVRQIAGRPQAGARHDRAQHPANSTMSHKQFGGLDVIDELDLRRPPRLAHGADRAERRRQDHGVQPHHRRLCGRSRHASMSMASTSPHVPSSRRVDHGVARSFQNVRLMPHLNALENVIVGQHSRNRGFFGVLQPVNLTRNNRWKEEARAALHDAGLGEYERAAVGSLPYGVQKRIELVRALMAHPRLLLLDEPAAGLNPAETDDLQRQLRTICEQRRCHAAGGRARHAIRRRAVRACGGHQLRQEDRRRHAEGHPAGRAGCRKSISERRHPRRVKPKEARRAS